METDKLNREKTPRVIQQRGDGAVGVHVEDNRPKGSRNFLSGAPLQRLDGNVVGGGKAAQRQPSSVSTSTVVQRVEINDATGRFVYVTPADFANARNKQRVPFDFGQIQFIDYPGGEIRSADFSGCFMMAFRFNPLKAGEVSSLFPRRTVPPQINENIFENTYVAHVSNDMKEAVHDAEYKELISIEAIFRPYNMETFDRMGKPGRLSEEEQYRISQDPTKRYRQPFAGVHNLSAGMEQVTVDGETYWKGTVYRQERVIPQNPTGDRDYIWVNEVLEEYGRDEMEKRTSASMAYIYARVFLDNSCPTLKRRDAYQRLLVIRDQEPMALAYAYVELVDLSFDQEVWALLTSLYKINETRIGGIGRAGIAYGSARDIINASHVQRSSVDGGVMVSMATHIETLREIRRTSPGDIRWAFVAAMLNGDIEIMQYLKEFYYRR